MFHEVIFSDDFEQLLHKKTNACNVPFFNKFFVATAAHLLKIIALNWAVKGHHVMTRASSSLSNTHFSQAEI